MINIAFLIQNIDPSNGGSERVTIKISEELSKKSYNCYFIFGNKDNNSISPCNKLKIDVNATTKSIYKEIGNFLLTNKIKILIVVNQSFQNLKWQFIFKRLKLDLGIKIIASLHAAPDNWRKSDNFKLVLTKAYIKSRLKRYLCYIYNRNKIKSVGMYKLSDKFLLLSDKYIPLFQKVFKIDDSINNKLIAIPNPCPFNDAYNNEVRQNAVLICSRMDEGQKRIFMSLKIWYNIRNFTKGWKLILVGDGPYFERYRKYVKDKGLDNVLFVGHSNNVSNFYKTSKIFMMTSIWEGQPMSLIEAMHYGCVPIAINSFESITDLIIDRKNGLLCKVNDIVDFENKLKFLLQNESVVNEYSNSLLNTPNDYFSIERIVDKWNNILIQLNNF